MDKHCPNIPEDAILKIGTFKAYYPGQVVFDIQESAFPYSHDIVLAAQEINDTFGWQKVTFGASQNKIRAEDLSPDAPKRYLGVARPRYSYRSGRIIGGDITIFKNIVDWSYIHVPTLVLHEMLHVLGLNHYESDVFSIMSTNQPYGIKRTIRQEDVEVLKCIYSGEIR